MKNKKGQEIFGMSYGVIFSIILIISVIAVGFFVIRHFLNLGDCTNTGLFYESFENKIDSCWKSGICKDDLSSLKEKTTKSMEKICFGYINQSSTREDAIYKSAIKDFAFESSFKNVHLYPPEKMCDGRLPSKKVEHFSTTNFFCLSPEELEKAKLDKGTTEKVVSLSRN